MEEKLTGDKLRLHLANKELEALQIELKQLQASKIQLAQEHKAFEHFLNSDSIKSMSLEEIKDKIEEILSPETRAAIFRFLGIMLRAHQESQKENTGRPAFKESKSTLKNGFIELALIQHILNTRKNLTPRMQAKLIKRYKKIQ